MPAISIMTVRRRKKSTNVALVKFPLVSWQDLRGQKKKVNKIFTTIISS